MAAKLGCLTVVVLVGLLCVEQTLGFAFRVYPGFKANQQQGGVDRTAAGFFQPQQISSYNAAVAGLNRNMAALQSRQQEARMQLQQPMLEVVESSTASDVEKSAVTSDPGLKAITFRRAGPLDECDNYLDCKSRLLSYLDVMMKMSNKG